jgi:hypothetical protein
VSRQRRRDDKPGPDDPVTGSGVQPAAGNIPAFPTAPHHVAVLLNQQRINAHPGDGYEPLEGYILGMEFTVEAASALAACEIAYSITHSSPGDMHCPDAYGPVVETYFGLAHFRPLSVEDVVEIDGVRYACARFGFRAVPV